MTKHGDGQARIPSTQRVEVEVAELPSGLKIHRNEKDEVAKHRARVLARVFFQKPRIDFQEVFAPAFDLNGDPADISYGSLPVNLFDVKMSR